MHNTESESPNIETGVVTNLQNGNAIVELNLQPACESCGAKVLCVPDVNGKRALRVSNPLHAQIGNRVAIGESSDFLLKIAAVQYGIPFVGFMLGIFFFYFLNFTINGIAKELIYFTGGLIGLGISAFISRNISQQLAESKKSLFTIIKIMG